MSERDGWRHVYRVPRDGGAADLITHFEADVIARSARTGQTAGFISLRPRRMQHSGTCIDRSSTVGSAGARDAAESAWDAFYDLSPDGRLAFHTWSQIDSPPVTDVVELPVHRSLRPLTDPTALKAKLTAVSEDTQWSSTASISAAASCSMAGS